jgi:ADP-ribosyl-[dinitrogen reductase] hydrolase
MSDIQNRLAGILLGTAVGDSLGLPVEGLSARRRKRLMPGPWRQRLFCGRSMVSDDTEHALFVGQSLLRHPDDAAAFQRRLAWHLRWWLASLPAGVGKATAKACLKLWLGFSPSRSGVLSAGNGPAMRSAIIGGYFFDRPEMIEKYAVASTQLTHTDPRAEVGAKAIARVAAWAVMHAPMEKPPIDAIMAMLREISPADGEWNQRIGCIQEAAQKNVSVLDFAVSQGLEEGVSGYIYHTAPVAIYAWLKHYGDFRATLEAVLDCGGDADTVGAIAGALAGATVGADKIPEDWLHGIRDWPRSIGLLRRVSTRLADQQSAGKPLGEVSYFWPAVLPRNLFFLLLVLFHGFRRLAPPY